MNIDDELQKLLGHKPRPSSCRVIATHEPSAKRLGPELEEEQDFQPSFLSRPSRAEDLPFEWRVGQEVSVVEDEEGEKEVVVPTLELRRSGYGDSVPWLSYGAAVDHLESLGDFSNLLQWKATFPGFRHMNVGLAKDELEGARFEWAVRLREETRNRSYHCISVLSELLSLRLDPQKGWRMTAANAVIHRTFGPGVTIATNGQEVILFDLPSERASLWTITARQNIIGPVSGTHIPPSEWNWSENKQVFNFPKNQGAALNNQKPKPKKSRAEGSNKPRLSADDILSNLISGL